MTAKPKHVPLRTCVVCREKRPKRELLRVVRTPEGEVLVDETGKLNGRGGYVCRTETDSDHWGEKQIRAKLAQALKAEISESDIERLNSAAVISK